MAKDTIIRCDICGRNDAESLSFIYDRKMDAAGSMENHYFTIDVCRLHRLEIYMAAGVSSTREFRAKFDRRLVDRSERIALGQKLVERIKIMKTTWETASVEDKKLSEQILALGDCSA